MSYAKKFIIRGLIGIPIGVFINQLVYLIMAINNDIVSISSSVIITQFFVSVLCGFYLAGVSVVFDIEEWSMLRQTITHSIAMLPYFPIAYYAGWMPKSDIGITLFIANYFVVYVIIWISFKKYWEKKAKEINLELKKRNNL